MPASRERSLSHQCAHKRPADFEYGEENDCNKIFASVHTIPAQFENGKKFDGKNSLQDFDAKEVYVHHKNRLVSFTKDRKMFCLLHFRLYTRCCFKIMPIRVPFSKYIVFKTCRQKKCCFRVSGRSIRQIFHRFQNMTASCERSLSHQ